MEKILIETNQFNNKKTLEIQKLFQTGTIKENDISEQQIYELKKLYHQQIDYLKQSIQLDKEKIIKIKKRLQNF